MTNETKDSTCISVSDGAVTPITKQPIEQISALDWPNLTISELYNHLSVLETRRNMAYEMNKIEIVNLLTSSINQLKTLIHSKQDNEGNLIT